MANNVVVLGARGAIGAALARLLQERYPAARVWAFARTPQTATNGVHVAPEGPTDVPCLSLDFEDETALLGAAQTVAEHGPIDKVFVTIGLLHGSNLSPEKSLRDLSISNFDRVFRANTIVPALLAKHFLPHLNRAAPSVFAALSARVGSVSDNRLGGWYAYRSSKAALNMVIKNAAIETARRNKNAVVVGLHPGTVNSRLSAPFQSNVRPGKLFTPEFSAAQLLNVVDGLTPSPNRQVFRLGRPGDRAMKPGIQVFKSDLEPRAASDGVPTTLSVGEIVEMAWCDKTSFEDIKQATGLSEKAVIDVMRRHMKPSSFRMWRKRVGGRLAKHAHRDGRRDLTRGDAQGEEDNDK